MIRIYINRSTCTKVHKFKRTNKRLLMYIGYYSSINPEYKVQQSYTLLCNSNYKIRDIVLRDWDLTKNYAISYMDWCG